MNVPFYVIIFRAGHRQSDPKDAGQNYLRFAICTVKLSMYICSVSFPDVSLSTSFCTDLTLVMRANNGVSVITKKRHDRTDCEDPLEMLRYPCVVRFSADLNIVDGTANLSSFSFLKASRTRSPAGGETTPHAGGSSIEYPENDIQLQDLCHSNVDG